jgi:NADPH:quinone reductase-like Zn-dependent oxidoreductase
MDGQMNMQAIIYKRYGGVEVLNQTSRPLPSPRPAEVLVRVKAAALNPIDCEIRAGRMWPVTGWRFPKIAGSDFAGEIVQLGPQVKDLQVGQAIYGFVPTTQGGAYAEYLTVHRDQTSPIPSGLDFQQAAALPLAAQTALQALRDLAKLQAGQEVFIHGASGGVGLLAIQIAKIMGARVIASCSHRNTELVKSLGADEVIDYTQNDIRKLGRVFPVFFDVYGNMPIHKVWHQVSKNGTHVTTIPSPANFWQQFNPLAKRRSRVVLVKSRRTDLQSIAEWVEKGQLQPIIDRVYPLAEAAEAQIYLESKRARGKVVLRVSS